MDYLFPERIFERMKFYAIQQALYAMPAFWAFLIKFTSNLSE